MFDSLQCTKQSPLLLNVRIAQTLSGQVWSVFHPALYCLCLICSPMLSLFGIIMRSHLGLTTAALTLQLHMCHISSGSFYQGLLEPKFIQRPPGLDRRPEGNSLRTTELPPPMAEGARAQAPHKPTGRRGLGNEGNRHIACCVCLARLLCLCSALLCLSESSNAV